MRDLYFSILFTFIKLIKETKLMLAFIFNFINEIRTAQSWDSLTYIVDCQYYQDHITAESREQWLLLEPKRFWKEISKGLVLVCNRRICSQSCCKCFIAQIKKYLEIAWTNFLFICFQFNRSLQLNYIFLTGWLPSKNKGYSKKNMLKKKKN